MIHSFAQSLVQAVPHVSDMQKYVFVSVVKLLFTFFLNVLNFFCLFVNGKIRRVGNICLKTPHLPVFDTSNHP